MGILLRGNAELNQNLKHILSELKDRPPKEDDQCAAETSGETQPPDSDEESDLDFSPTFDTDDVAIIGLALCRLQEAADDYIDSNGEEEADTFPYDGDTEKDFQANLATVRNLCPRIDTLTFDLAKLHQTMMLRDIARVIENEKRKFSDIAKALRGATA